MWFKRDVNRLVAAGKRDEAVATICKKFNISVAHAEDIIRELDQYQWHVRRIPGMDAKVKKMFADDPNGIVKVAKMIREATSWGLLETKLYMEDITKGMKPWPGTGDDDDGKGLLEAIFGGK